MEPSWIPLKSSRIKSNQIKSNPKSAHPHPTPTYTTTEQEQKQQQQHPSSKQNPLVLDDSGARCSRAETRSMVAQGRSIPKLKSDIHLS